MSPPGSSEHCAAHISARISSSCRCPSASVNHTCTVLTDSVVVGPRTHTHCGNLSCERQTAGILTWRWRMSFRTRFEMQLSLTMKLLENIPVLQIFLLLHLSLINGVQRGEAVCFVLKLNSLYLKTTYTLSYYVSYILIMNSFQNCCSVLYSKMCIIEILLIYAIKYMYCDYLMISMRRSQHRVLKLWPCVAFAP